MTIRKEIMEAADVQLRTLIVFRNTLLVIVALFLIGLWAFPHAGLIMSYVDPGTWASGDTADHSGWWIFAGLIDLAVLAGSGIGALHLNDTIEYRRQRSAVPESDGPPLKF